MASPPQVEGVIFDLDGTLADTIPLIVASFNAACREPMGRTYTTEEVVSRFGVPDAAMLRRELQDLPPAACEQAIEMFHRHYETEHAMVAAFEGVPELLHALHERGLPLGVMTGKGRRTADITLRMLGWTDIFGSVVTGDDVVNQKPHPDGVLLAARQLGVEPRRCIFVGDSPSDIKAGKAAGMFTVAAVWHDFYGERLRALAPDYYAQTPADVAALLGVTTET
ncbi:MAG: HAD family hydrolase [Armatimonadota bacterium]|nr:HAD family hydrolase [Armatimonadota bacterium]